jgi:hypothetical protein
LTLFTRIFLGYVSWWLAATSTPAMTEKELQETSTQDPESQPKTVTQGRDVTDVDYSVFTDSQRRYIVFMASWAGFFSPVSSQIYFPALNTLAKDLHVSNSLINLTLTSYMVSHLIV